MTQKLQYNITAEMWTSFNFQIVQEIKAFEGYTRGEAATVEVRGTWGDGGNGKARCVYQLRQVDGIWKVMRSRIDIN